MLNLNEFLVLIVSSSTLLIRDIPLSFISITRLNHVKMHVMHSDVNLTFYSFLYSATGKPQLQVTGVTDYILYLG